MSVTVEPRSVCWSSVSASVRCCTVCWTSLTVGVRRSGLVWLGSVTLAGGRLPPTSGRSTPPGVPGPCGEPEPGAGSATSHESAAAACAAWLGAALGHLGPQKPLGARA